MVYAGLDYISPYSFRTPCLGGTYYYFATTMKFGSHLAQVQEKHPTWKYFGAGLRLYKYSGRKEATAR